MSCGGAQQCRDAPVSVIKSMRDALEHPRAAQVESIDVRELRVGTIGHDRRLQPLAGGRAGNARQKARQPLAELLRLEHSAHEVRFGETRREEILARWFVIQRTVAVTQIELPSRI